MWNFDVLLNILPMDIFKDVKENEKKKLELNYTVRIWISFSTKALVKTSLSINSSNLAKMKI